MKVFLSPLADRKLELLLDYLETNWSLQIREDFLVKMDKYFRQISKQPRSCPESGELPNLFKCVVTKQSSFFYRIFTNEIEIITIIDNRQDPIQIVEEIKKWSWKRIVWKNPLNFRFFNFKQS